MNPTTNQPNMQPQNSGQPIETQANPPTTPAQAFSSNPQLSHDELGATLAFATHLHEQSLPKDMPQEGSQNAQNGSQTQEGDKNENEAEDNKMNDLESKIDKKLEVLRSEVKDSVKIEIDSIRKDIKEALTGEETNEQA